MNKKNVRKLINRLEGLLDSPQAAQFNMEYFGNKYYEGMRDVLQVPVCNTQACLAGEAVLATGHATINIHGGLDIPNLETTDIETGWYAEHAAAKVLGLTGREAADLFFFKPMNNYRKFKDRGWPKKFEAAYAAAKTPQGRLYVAIKRVEFFLEKGK